MREDVVLSVLFVLCLCSASTSATFTFREGPLELAFDESTGSLMRLTIAGETLAESAGPWPFSFGIGPSPSEVRWAEQLGYPRKLVKRAKPRPDTLELTVRVGPFEVIDRYRLHADRSRLDRSAVLTNRGEEAVKLRGFAFHTHGLRGAAGGFYRFPGKWPPGSHPFAEMQAGRHRSGRGSIAPAFAQLGSERCLMWASCTTDSPSVRVTERERSFQVSQGVGAAGYLRPGEPQQIGFVTMEVVPRPYWQALPHLWEWMDSVGIKVPSDRPRWIEEAILYEFHPGGTIGSRWTDLGGFQAATEKLLPTIRKLGCTAVWIQPIEHRSPYWPLDYYRFMAGLGTAQEYRALVAKAHELGLKVIQDIVPHGGAPQAVHNQAHPEFMLRREDGSHLSYWLNDFARPDWQDFIGKVAAHYVREYGVDGYRIDACYGSKEANWDPDIPYARASHARLHGGLGMVRRIRDEVKKLKPHEGAVLAEVESARHAAVSDVQYDFGLCYTVLHAWRKMAAADFVPLLQDYLEEQKYVYPRGTLFLRHIESHDSLRAEGWYGVEGMRAMYALTAFIQGVPLIYLDQDIGHGFALREINELRRSRPELSSGEAFYRVVQCDQPDVFTCLRKLGDRESVVLINLGRAVATVTMDRGPGSLVVPLAPVEYTLVSWRGGSYSMPFKRRTVPRGSLGLPRLQPRVAGTRVSFPGATDWLVDTVEGRLWDWYRGRYDGATEAPRSSIYWREQGTPVLWENQTLPLHCERHRVAANGGSVYVTFSDRAHPGLKLIEAEGPANRLTLCGYPGWEAKKGRTKQPTPAPGLAVTPVEGVEFRVVGPDYIVSNGYFACVLRRQGGVVRELIVGGKQCVVDHDLYGDQAYFAHPRARRVEAQNDVESGIGLWRAEDGLHLRFEGQLRGFSRFALQRPPLWYRNEYVFTDAPRFTQRWAFRTEKTFEEKTAFLAWFLRLPASDRFRLLRGGEVVAEGPVGQGGSRRGETGGGSPPGAIEFLAGGEPQWRLCGLNTPREAGLNVFVHGRNVFITLLDGKGSGMEAGRWYEFEAAWAVGAE
ncbi:MAG: alpha-amylase family glycosyl hydrolase [Candidatus Brocadiia bacterium]